MDAGANNTADNAVDKINESVSLGGNIELVGFRELDGGSMVILKKLIGNHVRRMHTTTSGQVDKLTLTLKPVHGEKTNKYEIQGKLIANGKPYASEVTDFNLFFTLDKVLTKIQNSLGK